MGQFISTVVMLLGYSIIAVPTGIVVGETIHEHKHSGRKGQEEEVVPEEFNEYEDKKKTVAQPAANSQEPTANGQEPTADSQQSTPKLFCTHCGHTESDPDARYCRYCGTLLSKTQPSGWINDFFAGE